MALSERTGCVLHTTLHVALRVSWSRRSPLAELLQFVECDVLLGGRSQVVLLLFGPRIVVNLVENNHRRFVGAAQVLQSILHYIYLLLKVGM